jgi:hypothetical protein
MAPGIQLTYEFVKSKFDEIGYTLLSTIYNNNRQKLDFICDKGHKHSISFAGFYNQNQRCAICFGTPKKLYKDVLELFKKCNYTLLSKEYINNKTPLEYICDKNHISKICLSDFLSGKRCRKCYEESRTIYSRDNSTSSYTAYKIISVRFSNKIYKKYKKDINPNNLKRSKKDYQLDHKFSIVHGYINNITPEIISNPYNLQMLHSFDNNVKNFRSDISYKELLIGYELFQLYKELH